MVGTDDPEDLDPDAFDPEGITQRLAECAGQGRPPGGAGDGAGTTSVKRPHRKSD
jgi:hypothetical protein